MANPKRKSVAAPDAGNDDGVATVVCGAVFPLDPSEILAHREYGDRVVVVTVDGRKLVAPKEVA